ARGTMCSGRVQSFDQSTRVSGVVAVFVVIVVRIVGGGFGSFRGSFLVDTVDGVGGRQVFALGLALGLVSRTGDVEGHFRGDVGMQRQRHFVQADGLDRVVEV